MRRNPELFNAAYMTIVKIVYKYPPKTKMPMVARRQVWELHRLMGTAFLDCKRWYASSKAHYRQMILDERQLIREIMTELGAGK